MKKLIILFAVFFGINGFVFSQEINQVRIDADKIMLKDQMRSGGFEMFFNQRMDKGEITRNAAYYEPYFDVVYNPASGSAQISFKNDDQMSRRIVERFLYSNHINEIIIGTETLSVTDFVNQFLN